MPISIPTRSTTCLAGAQPTSGSTSGFGPGRRQVVTIADLDLRVDLAAGEEIHTEISAKFRRDRLSAELAGCGLEVRRWWTDPTEGFGVALAWRN